ASGPSAPGNQWPGPGRRRYPAGASIRRSPRGRRFHAPAHGGRAPPWRLPGRPGRGTGSPRGPPEGPRSPPGGRPPGPCSAGFQKGSYRLPEDGLAAPALAQREQGTLAAAGRQTILLQPRELTTTPARPRGRQQAPGEQGQERPPAAAGPLAPADIFGPLEA